ncbi:hypothetical protein WP50_05735 [Lactiplantibacillus plantarum]|nr:hypothetical protein WP50_05735 [Lactiplantibacillus plantarum]
MRGLIASAQLTPSDLQYVICHQANLRIIEKIAANLALPMTKFPHNIARKRYGHSLWTSTADY